MSYRAVAGEKHQQQRTPGLVFFTNRAAIRNMHKSNVSLIFFIGMSYRAVAGEKHQQQRTPGLVFFTNGAAERNMHLQ